MKTKRYNGLQRIFGNLPVFDHFDDKLGGEDKTLESQSSGDRLKDMKIMLALPAW
jgi:hypothetical protein